MTLDDWIILDKNNRKDALVAIISNMFPSNRYIIDNASMHSNYPRIIVNLHGIEIPLRLIFSHISCFGLSNICQQKAEAISFPLQATIEEMKPYVTQQLKSFAIAETPISEAIVKKIIPAYENCRNYPAYLSRDQIEYCCEYFGARLPTEIEWEAIVRCGTDRVFPFGDILLSEDDLSSWMEFDYSKEMASLENGVKGVFLASGVTIYLMSTMKLMQRQLKGPML